MVSVSTEWPEGQITPRLQDYGAHVWAATILSSTLLIHAAQPGVSLLLKGLSRPLRVMERSSRREL